MHYNTNQRKNMHLQLKKLNLRVANLKLLTIIEMNRAEDTMNTKG